jgi:hypothetical protein
LLVNDSPLTVPKAAVVDVCCASHSHIPPSQAKESWSLKGVCDGETINVRRKIWNDHVGAPKTEAREAGVYVVLLLRKILAKYKASYPSVGDGSIFRGEKLLRPLDLDNLSQRDIPQYINGAWFGCHAFRRGLTRLNEAGVDDTEIQSILRYDDVSTTQAFYILPNRERAETGLRKLDKTLRTKYGIKG